MPSLSPLELLHPAGTIRHARVAGGAAPAWLVPAAAVPADRDVDLALIAPTRAELAQEGWLESALAAAATAVADDGILYAILPQRKRAAAARLIARSGLRIETRLAHLAHNAPRYLVPLRLRAWRYAFGSLIAAQPRVRRLLLAAGALPRAERWLEAVVPAVGILARRPAGRPVAAWVAGLSGRPGPPRDPVMALSWRGADGSALLHCFEEEGERPWGIVKIAPGGSGEARRLATLGPIAARAGVRVPELLAEGALGDRSVLAETVLDGVPAGAVLEREPTRAGEVSAALAAWIERWNVATGDRRDGRARLESDLMAAVGELARLLPDARGYRRRLANACAELGPDAVPLVAAHNDLTMWNVLLDSVGGIGVLDWGEAEESGLPMSDFFYASVDATAATHGYRSRLLAIQTCFPATGGGTAAPWRASLERSLAMRPEASELCFHACWLHHARNEVAGGTTGGAFLEIARWVAAASARRLP